MEPLTITVHRPSDVTSPLPVTGGVPLAEGAAPAGSTFGLSDAGGNHLPLQTTILARWPDGSARWVLLDFQSTQESARDTFLLAIASETGGLEPAGPVCVPSSGTPALSNAALTVQPAAAALVSVNDRLAVGMELVTEDGARCRAVAESCEVEVSGPLRGVLQFRGNFRRPDGERVFQFRLRVSAYAGLATLRLEPLIVIDASGGVICPVRELSVLVRTSEPAMAGCLGGAPGWEGATAQPVTLYQRDDERYELRGADGHGAKAPGWASLRTADGAVALALRDFWQQWPKSLEVSADGLKLGLLPAFDEDDFSHMSPDFKHQWFFRGNCYQLRSGQARSWEMWLDLDGDGAGLAQLAAAPPLPVTAPAQAIASGVWGPIAPAGSPEMSAYDPWARALFDSYVNSIEAQRDYGAMNWGDWFGERHINWGNHEYDTTNQLLMQFARTGDPACFYWADRAGRHSAEVDTVHHVNADLCAYFSRWARPSYPARPGMVHEHAHGHVGGFTDEDEVRRLLHEHGIGRHTDRPYSCLDPFNLGHIWTTGMMRLYFLTGNPFLKETVEVVGDNLVRLVEDGEYQFMGHTHCGRTTGWPLLAIGGAYELNLDRRFVDAMRRLAEAALEMQDPVCGGWIVHPMAADHCVCKTARHTGMATFITAVLINGLARYHELSGDERMVRCIDEAVSYINNDTWRENLRGWRYTSCPGHRTASQPGVVIMAYVNAVRMTGNPEHTRILRLAWDEKFRQLLDSPPGPGPGQGKAYSATIYGCSEAAGLLAGEELEC